MQKPQKFIDALQEDTEWMYNELKKVWIKNFSQKWWISDVTMRKYMPSKPDISLEEIQELKDKIKMLRNEWKTNVEIKTILKISMYRVISLSSKEPRQQLTDEQKRE